MPHVITVFRNGYDIEQRHVPCEVDLYNDNRSKLFKQLHLCHFKICATILSIILTKYTYSFFTRECQRPTESRMFILLEHDYFNAYSPPHCTSPVPHDTEREFKVQF